MSVVALHYALQARRGPLFAAPGNFYLKDPCPVFYGNAWHLYATLCTPHGLEVIHAVASALWGPWEVQPLRLTGLSGREVGGPGIIVDRPRRALHMFIQTCFSDLGGSIEHLVSTDGETFSHADTALWSVPGGNEAGIYDPHPTMINRRKYLVYAAMSRVAHPDLHLAVSSVNSWSGPWRRLGPILRHEEVEHHNRHDHPEYEWGLEGPQLIQLPSGRVLLNAVCFLPDARHGERQRLFFAVANSVRGPYRTLGPILPTIPATWESGENGHGAGLIVDDRLEIFYQACSAEGHWSLGCATWQLERLEAAVSAVLGQAAGR